MQSRREALTAARALAAGTALLNEVVAAPQNPAAQVQDRSSTIRITRLRATLLSPAVFIKIETNHGITGWGEIKGVDPRVARPLVESLYELLDNENPTRIEHLWQKIYRAHRDIRGGAFMVHTLAGIDMALWDITGKLRGVPVHRLLGGPTRDKIRIYPTAKAHKVPPHGIYDHSGNPSTSEE